MPLYDYRCRGCGREFEVLVMGGETPACPYCQSTDLDKQMSTFAYRSKGSDGTTTSGGSKCSGCAGGSCSTCH